MIGLESLIEVAAKVQDEEKNEYGPKRRIDGNGTFSSNEMWKLCFNFVCFCSYEYKIETKKQNQPFVPI